MKLITSYKGVQFLPPEVKNAENNSNEIESMWDFRKNEKSFDSYGAQSYHEAWWKCPVCGHEWHESIRNFTKRKIKCPMCKERSLSIINDNETMKYWNWDKNKDLDPKIINRRSMTKAHWKCPECGYEWQASVLSVLKKKEKCRKCNSKKKRKKGSKKTVHCFLDTVPALKNEFVKMLNESDDVKMQTTASRKTALWRCSKCGYEWKSAIRSRIMRVATGYQIKPCPACNSQAPVAGSHSRVNIKYYFKYPVLNEIYSSENNSVPINELDWRYMDTKLTFFCVKHGNYKMTLRSMIDLIRKGRTPCPVCRKEENSKSLADTFPDLALDWSDKNEESATEAKSYSTKVVHWKCHVCGTEWDASIFNRTRGNKKCPKCSASKEYTDRFPELRNIFDSSANGTTADSLKHKDSSTSFTWICSKHGSYKRKLVTVIRHLKNKENPCPLCRKELGKSAVVKIVKNPLSTNHPDLVKEWSSKNSYLPNEVSEFSRKKAIWKCQKCGNEWEARITDRARGFKSCPICYPFGKNGGKLLLETRPDLKKHYSSENDQPFESLSSVTRKSVVWICDNGHKFTRKVVTMTSLKEFQCPKCTGSIVAEDNNIIANHPELIDEWDTEKNKIDPYSLMDGSHYEAYWKCKQCGHKYRLRINRKLLYDTEGKISCPYCANRKASDDNNLAVTNPEILSEWDYDANTAEGIDPHNVLARNVIMAHWICSDCGSHYDMTISERVQRENDDQISCPYCRGWLVNETNCLKTIHPDLMKEWAPWENALIEIEADKITENYNGKAWWICPICNYKYSMSVKVRCLKEKRHQNACPRCNGRLQKRTHFF